MKTPYVTLVGAGPGDPELITLKAVRVLATADVVLYDALVSEEVLKLIPLGVPSFSVGKRSGEHSYSQDKINELLVDFANQYGHVVRLKGGDPFMFGRGSEEIDFVREQNIEVAVIPGISSALAVPAAAGIPVTARGVSESVWVLTGTTKAGSLSNDISIAATSTATLVILMGVNKLEEIVQVLTDAGRPHALVAVVQNGTLPSQQTVIATADRIVDEVKNRGIGAPAIIVVGEVVRHASLLKQTIHSVLASA